MKIRIQFYITENEYALMDELTTGTGNIKRSEMATYIFRKGLESLTNR